jgi:hypothetical protein
MAQRTWHLELFAVPFNKQTTPVKGHEQSALFRY